MDDLSLAVSKNEIHVLLGTCGKSTLAYAILGCEGCFPPSGEIWFAGKNINSLTIHERAQPGSGAAGEADSPPARLSLVFRLIEGFPYSLPVFCIDAFTQSCCQILQGQRKAGSQKCKAG